MLLGTTLPSASAVFFPGRPSSMRMRRDFVSGTLMLSVRNLAQRRTTSSRPRGERHGLSVTYQHPTEHSADFAAASDLSHGDFVLRECKGVGDGCCKK